MKKFLTLAMALMLLTGCADQIADHPPADYTLDQMLAGKSKEEQRAILKDLCLQEVQKTPFDRLVHHMYREDPEVPMLAQICNKMAAEMAPCNIEMH